MMKKILSCALLLSLAGVVLAEDWQTIYENASNEYNGKRYEDAYDFFKQSVEEASTPQQKYKSYLHCAYSAYALGKYSESQRYASRAISVKGISDDQKTRAYYYKLVARYRLDKKDNAEAMAEIISKNKPFSGSLLGASMYFSSYNWYLKKDYKKALKLSDVGIELSKPYTTYYYLNTVQQIRCLRKLNKFNEAFKLAEETDLKKWPGRYLGELYYEIGYCCFLNEERQEYPDKRDYTRALKFFKMSVNAHEDDCRKAKSIYFAGLSHKKMKKYKEAKTSFDLILDMADSPERYKYRAQFHIADIYFILKNYKKASTEFSKVPGMECVTVYWKSRALLMEGESYKELGNKKASQNAFSQAAGLEGAPIWVIKEAKKNI
ncbi:MAG: hypothetical protein GY750_10440 [Lentisphaerae bacterium]|nr:hypothetical protein [Lentisphaerota bacterium]MCP4101829.1 hypothetical protein [Lentisphaerota bacterium]